MQMILVNILTRAYTFMIKKMPIFHRKNRIRYASLPEQSILGLISRDYQTVAKMICYCYCLKVPEK